MTLRDVNAGISGAVRALMADAEPKHRAAYLLALRLAESYEESLEAKDASALLSALDAILATPKSQRVTSKPAAREDAVSVSPLARLRAVHSQGLDGA